MLRRQKMISKLWIYEPRILFGNHVFEFYPFNSHWPPQRIANASVRLFVLISILCSALGYFGALQTYCVFGIISVTVIAMFMQKGLPNSDRTFEAHRQ
jgi:hypothetical protein